LNRRLESTQKQIAHLRSESQAGMSPEELLAGTLQQARQLAIECSWLHLHSAEIAQQKGRPTLLGAIDSSSVETAAQKLKQAITLDLDGGDGTDVAMGEELQRYENTTFILNKRATSMRVQLLHLSAAVTELVRALKLVELSRSDALHALHSEERALRQLHRLAAAYQKHAEVKCFDATGGNSSASIVEILQQVEAEFSDFKSISEAEPHDSATWKKSLEAAELLGASDVAAAIAASADSSQNIVAGSDKVDKQPQIQALQKSVSEGARACEETMSKLQDIIHVSQAIELPPEIKVTELFPEVGSSDPSIERSIESRVPYMLARQKAVDAACSIARFRTEIFADKVDLAATLKLTSECKARLSSSAVAEEAEATKQHIVQSRSSDALQEVRRVLQQQIAQQASDKDRLVIDRHALERAKEKSMQKQKSEAERVEQLQTKLQSMAPDERQRLIDSLNAQLQKAQEDFLVAGQERDRLRHACNDEIEQNKRKREEQSKTQEGLRGQIKARKKELKDVQDEWKKREEPLTKRVRAAVSVLQQNKEHFDKSNDQKRKLLEKERRKVGTWKSQVAPKQSAVEEARKAFQEEEASRANTISELEATFKKIRDEYRSTISKLSEEDKAALLSKEAALKKKLAPVAKVSKANDAPKAIEVPATA